MSTGSFYDASSLCGLGREMFSSERDSLRREIAITLAVKFVLIFVIWFAFFRGSEVSLSDKTVGDVLFGGDAVAHSQRIQQGAGR